MKNRRVFEIEYTHIWRKTVKDASNELEKMLLREANQIGLMGYCIDAFTYTDNPIGPEIKIGLHCHQEGLWKRIKRLFSFVVKR